MITSQNSFGIARVRQQNPISNNIVGVTISAFTKYHNNDIFDE